MGVPPNQAFLGVLNRLRRNTPLSIEPEPDVPTFVIRDRILASIAQAGRAWRARGAEDCQTYAEWEAVCEARERALW
ncbi:hypothetical protein GCM10010282_38170 [Streptomyces roseolus]|nr:hypothetical protein GCM10010282_38170 [Streptomyces roseolus]